MKKFTGLFVVLTLMLFGGVMTAQAQMDTTYCGSLTADECAPLVMSAETLPSSAEFVMNGSVNFEMGEETFDVSFSADGSYIADDMTQIALMAVNQSTGDVMESMTQFSDIVTGLDANLEVNVTPPAEAMQMGIPNPLILNLWLQDGTGYVDLGALGLSPELTGIYGIDLTQLLDMGMTQMDTSDIETFEMNREEVFQMLMDDPTLFEEHITVTRSDGDLDGTPVATFEIVVDVAGLLSEEPLQAAILDMQLNQMDMTDEMTPTEDEMQMVLESLPLVFSESFVNITQTVGTENGYVYETRADIDINVDPSAMPVIDEEMADMGSEEPISIMIDLELSKMNFDSVSDIGLPEGAQVVPLEELGIPMGMMETTTQ